MKALVVIFSLLCLLSVVLAQPLLWYTAPSYGYAYQYTYPAYSPYTSAYVLPAWYFKR
ncbi:hypothetical protein X975_24429, partial [Stegodyphus mimosarum]